MKSGNSNANDDLPEVHASAAGLKALCCCMAADGIEDLRRACGGTRNFSLLLTILFLVLNDL